MKNCQPPERLFFFRTADFFDFQFLGRLRRFVLIVEQRLHEPQNLRLIERVLKFYLAGHVSGIQKSLLLEPPLKLPGDANASVDDLGPSSHDAADGPAQKRIVRTAHHDRVNGDLEIRLELVKKVHLDLRPA